MQSHADIPVSTSADDYTWQSIQHLDRRQQVTSNELHFYCQEARTAFQQREAGFRLETQRYEVLAHEASGNGLRAVAKQFGSDLRSRIHICEHKNLDQT